MEYNKEQQEVLIQDFIDKLFVQRNLSSNTLYSYKNDLQNFFQVAGKTALWRYQ